MVLEVSCTLCARGVVHLAKFSNTRAAWVQLWSTFLWLRARIAPHCGESSLYMEETVIIIMGLLGLPSAEAIVLGTSLWLQLSSCCDRGVVLVASLSIARGVWVQWV